MNIQDLILQLQMFWGEHGCLIQQPIDIEVGAGTFHPSTFLRSLGPEPWNACYVQPCRRPSDGRYGENPNRLGQYYQYQVIMKPSPINIQDIYLDSLKKIGLDTKHDIRFVEDDWKSPTLGAWGLGWEVWLDGMEITQFTYFQQVGGIDLHPVSVELTYGIERIAMHQQDKDNVFDLQWNNDVTYGQLFKQSEIEFSHYNFQSADIKQHASLFEVYESECLRLIKDQQVLPAYDYCMKASHVFNVLDARGAIGVTERQRFIARIRSLARHCARQYLDSRKEEGFPLLGNLGKQAAQSFDAVADQGLNASVAAACAVLSDKTE